MTWLYLLIACLLLLIPLAAVLLDSQLGRAVASRIERGGGRDTELAQRVQLLEAEVERLSRTTHRLEEESEFMQRLIEDRTAGGKALPGAED
jgi:predicted RNase H-like nuclease (RuvC/YqgF family)